MVETGSTEGAINGEDRQHRGWQLMQEMGSKEGVAD